MTRFNSGKLLLLTLGVISTILMPGRAIEPEAAMAADKIDPQTAQTLKKISALVADHDYDKALPMAEAVLKVYPQNFQAHVLRGDAYGGLEEDEKALADYLWAIKINPNDGHVHLAVAESYFLLNKTDKALAENMEALKYARSVGEKMVVWDRRRDYLKHMGKYLEAEQAADKMIEFVPNHPHNSLERAKLRLLNQHWTGAIEDINFCMKNMPQFYCRLLQMRATAYSGLRQYDKAIVDLKKAVANQPEERMLHVSLMEAYQKAGKKDLAAREGLAIKTIDEHINP